MKAICFIEARMRSTRLPGKVLRTIQGKPMLELMVERVRRAKTIEGVVIATTDQSADDPIVELSEKLSIGVFRGSEDDVLGRVLGAAHAYDADLIVETTGDSPLQDPAIIDIAVSDFLLGGADFVSNIFPYSSPRGTDVRVFTKDSLDEINRISKDPADHEHVSLHYWEHPEKYRLRNVTIPLPKEAASLRLTVDTPEDFRLVELVYAELYPKNPEFTIGDVAELFQRRPELAGINSQIVQKSAR